VRLEIVTIAWKAIEAIVAIGAVVAAGASHSWASASTA
jgi:hypothetical protein